MLKTLDLNFALRRLSIPVEFEIYDRYITIDIAIPDCKVNIKVDGSYHNYDASKALAGLNNPFQLFKHYLKLCLPNFLIAGDLKEKVTSIMNFYECK